MSFPPAFLEELRARLPLSEVVGRHIHITRSGREYKACCPFHAEKSASFYINDDKQFFHCFGCGAHGDIIGFTMRYSRLSFPEAIENLAGQAGLTVPRPTTADQGRFDEEKRLLNLLDRATAWFEEQLYIPTGRDAYAYLRGRGLSEDAMRRFRLGYAPQDAKALITRLSTDGYSTADMMAVGLIKKSEERGDYYSFFRNRVIFPVGDRRGRTVAFGGRVMGDGEPKYLNSPDHSLFHKGRLLYGLSRARAAIHTRQPLIVVEGYMDVIALVEAGFQGAVAPLGTALTEDQMTVLWKLLPPLASREADHDYSPILCFDGDKAGLRAAERAVERLIPLLTPSHTFRIATMPEGQDPDELIKAHGPNAMTAVLSQAKPMIDVVWELGLTGRRLETPEDRAALSVTLMQRIGRIDDEALRTLYKDEIHRRLRNLWGTQADQRRLPSSSSHNTLHHRYKEKHGDKRFSPPPPLLTRKAPANAKMLRERILLALMINHPMLFQDYGEHFAQITFRDRALATIKQMVIDHLAHHESDEIAATDVRETLFSALSAPNQPKSLYSDLAEALSDSTYRHAAFARPDQSFDHARAGWRALWSGYAQEQLEADLLVARQRYAESATDENYARLMALREHMENLRLNSAGEDS